MKILKFLLTGGVIAAISFSMFYFYDTYKTEKEIFNTLPEELKNSPYATMIKEDMIKLLEEKDNTINNLKSDITNLNIDKNTLIEKNNKLAELQLTKESLDKEKNEWNKEIALENPDTYISHYEELNPEVAQEIYTKLKGNQVFNEKETEIYTMLGSLDEKKSAEIVTKLLTTDETLLKKMLSSLNKGKKTKILNEMSSTDVSKVIKLLESDLNSK